MTRGILDYFISSVFAAFNKPKANGEVRKHLSERLGDIPDEAVPWILEKIEVEEKFPPNLVLTTKKLWSSWLASHPDKRAEAEEGKCPLGCDNGSFSAWKQDAAGVWTQYAFDCPNCRPSGQRVATPKWLRQQGYRVQRPGESECQIRAELYGRPYSRSAASVEMEERIRAAKGRDNGRSWDRDVHGRTRGVEMAVNGLLFEERQIC